MPNKKDQRSNVRWSEKNRLYLQKLGLIDQHGKSKGNVQSVNDFVNQCVTIVCESSMNPRQSIADSDDLRNAYALMQYRHIGKEIQKLMDLRHKARESMTEAFAVVNA